MDRGGGTGILRDERATPPGTVRDAVPATRGTNAQGELRYAMENELRRAVDVLLDDALQLTAAAMEEAVVKAQPVQVEQQRAEVVEAPGPAVVVARA